MKYRNGFVNVLILVIVLTVIGGGLYVVLGKQDQAANQDPFVMGFKEGETDFVAKTETRNGVLEVVFGAQITRSDGEKYEAFILFGDGEETNVAHWSPTMFNEQVRHVYKPGAYTASLVLVPKTLLTEDVQQRRIKIQELKGLTTIQTVRIEVEGGTATIND